MPLEMKRRVCLCPASAGGKLVWLHKKYGADSISVHSVCGKPESYWVHRCETCEQLFIKDFKSVWCARSMTCWDCGQDNEPCYHDGCSWYPDKTLGQWIPPQLPKPRIFTSNELDSILGDLKFDL